MLIPESLWILLFSIIFSQCSVVTVQLLCAWVMYSAARAFTSEQRAVGFSQPKAQKCYQRVFPHEGFTGIFDCHALSWICIRTAYTKCLNDLKSGLTYRKMHLLLLSTHTEWWTKFDLRNLLEIGNNWGLHFLVECSQHWNSLPRLVWQSLSLLAISAICKVPGPCLKGDFFLELMG